MSDIKLKPCPFCGGEAKLRKKNRTIIEGNTRRNCYVYCLRCGARGTRYIEGSTEQEHMQARKMALLAWNERYEEQEHERSRDI